MKSIKAIVATALFLLLSAPAARSAAPIEPIKEDAAANANSVKGLSPADRAAIFKSAKAKSVGKNRWRMCVDDPSPSATDSKIEFVRDLNGDGRPEALVTEGGTFCYGNTGEAFVLVTKSANGRWKEMISTPGIAVFLTSRGVGGYPDIEVGGPGFCFPVLRWNGKTYAPAGNIGDDGKACKS